MYAPKTAQLRRRATRPMGRIPQIGVFLAALVAMTLPVALATADRTKPTHLQSVVARGNEKSLKPGPSVPEPQPIFNRARRSEAASPGTTSVYKPYGLDFGPYTDGQDPNLQTEISEAQLLARMQIIAGNTLWVRSFGCTHGLEKIGMVAHSLGLKAAVGAWLSKDLSANAQEISNLITAANSGQVDLAIVGSEVFQRNDLSESQLIAYMNQVRQQIPANIPVATADVFGKLLEHPAVIANSDVVLPNYYPFWNGESVNTSIATLHRQHQQIVAVAQGKPVIVSETGWPSAGDTLCNAVPSPANASFYFLNFVSWARANNVSYFYFDALDEAFKANHGEGPQGAHWGVWDKDGVLKPGMQTVFDGQTMADNWTSISVPGGPGTPSMAFVYVPPYGSSNHLFGQVFHVNTDDYKVAVYIRVGSGWWTKPTFDTPLTNIGLDGGWECDITTGGNDVLANQIVAYLVPKDFFPPKMQGEPTLPATLDQNSVAKTEIARPGSSPYLVGQVTDSNNKGLNCVTISLTGSQTTTTHTVYNGSYSFLNLAPGGNYTVTPSYPGYTFNPPSLTSNNLASNQTGNFVALPNYTVMLGALPASGGTVNGGGTFASGSSRTVTATANSGYTFVNWTENGGVVSTSASYAFTLNGDRSLVANFNVSTVQATVQTNPSGRTFTVDGTSYSAAQTFSWTPGSSHTISTTSTQSGATGTQYVWSGWSDGAAISHTVAPTSATTYTANFTTQYLLTMGAGAGGTVSPPSGYFTSGQSVNISASPNTGFTFSSWTGSGSGSFTGSTSPSSVTMSGPITETANFSQSNIQTTVQTNPSGRNFTVDGTTYSTTLTFSWIPGSSHTISTTSPQAGASGTQYVWSNWSDGGAISHTVVPNNDTTYTANFTTQYLLTTNAGTGGTVSPSSAFFNSGQGVSISATPNSGFTFSNWSGTGTGSFSGSTNPASVTMNGPITETANFTPNLQVSVQTSPTGHTFTVDGNTYSTTQTFSWIPGSSHTISTTSPQSGATGTQYVWSSWSDGGAISHSVTPSSNTTYTANFTTQFLLTMNAGTGGTVSPASTFFNSGQGVSISATPNSGFTFSNWSGTGTGSFSGTTNPATVTMNGPITETANFTPNIQVTVQTNPSGRTFTIDGTTYSTTQTLSWALGSSHTISTTSPQAGGTGTQFVWGNWSDSGAISHTVSPSSATTYTANFVTQFLLTMNTGTGGTVSPASGFFNSGQGVNISATPNANFSFSGWTGSGSGSFTGSTNPASVTMNAPITETASFVAIPKTIQLSASSYSINEGGQILNINLTRSGDATAAASVSFATSDGAGLQNCNVTNGKASSRCDYISTLGTVNFAAGETSKTLSILIVDDSYAEGDETFSITLTNPSGATLGPQALATITIKDNDTTTGVNQIDQAGFFVNEHYFDFLNRQPDPSGLAFWTNEITSCGSNQSCIEVKRINVSAAYFLSIEFQSTGYLVERLYKAAYGSATGNSTFGGSHTLPVPIIRLNEFLPDTQAISKGVVVGQTGWEQAIENNKVAFTSEFVQRSRFSSAYLTSLTPTQFVDALFANAGVTPSPTDRSAAISEFGVALNTADLAARGRVLRRVAENSILSANESNRAFVLMQYFGYLRRNPNDPQDSDYTGYDFWLTKLNQFNGNFQSAEMVKAFIVSGEYRGRFGP